MFRKPTLVAIVVVPGFASQRLIAEEANLPPTLWPDELGTTTNVHFLGLTLLASQAAAEGLIAAAKRGIKTLISLHQEGETRRG